MFEPQHFVDLQGDSGFGDASSWLSGDDDLRRPHQSSAAASSGNGNLDRRLFNDLVEMVPLIEHYIKERSSFKRRGSMIYTKTPSREALARRVPDLRGRNASQPIPGRKKRDPEGNNDGKSENKEQDGENVRALATAEREEMKSLREKVDELQRKLLEKDELLKSMELSKNQVNETHAKLEEMKRLVTEKESFIKSMQSQLSDTKFKLADKQAALEKTQWEAKTTGTKATKLQEMLDAVQGEVSSFMRLFEALTKSDSNKKYDGVFDVTPYEFDHLPYIDDIDETHLRKMEEARETYVAAVATAKEKQDEESMAAAAKARAYLQSIAFMY
ncbi:PREDICTED: uncharacterized protein LOC104818357 isoform X2 [Tarenaya hassleriana]|uniref:uncharacterized protein LOC104818357 isoform X2 n=1 Tax=Tarenaya hassleriana TaxID=28532 RepID=UPI00053C1E79|nr:PREDICTED: uncharacterized protein LOC104818357 isoform X2 [Tarenaya hassleriana]